jgi:hypothetical protein
MADDDDEAGGDEAGAAVRESTAGRLRDILTTPAGWAAVGTLIAAVTGVAALFVARADGDQTAAPPTPVTGQSAWAAAAAGICKDQRFKVQELDANLQQRAAALQPAVGEPVSEADLNALKNVFISTTEQKLDVMEETLAFLTSISEKGAEQTKAQPMMDEWRSAISMRLESLAPH